MGLTLNTPKTKIVSKFTPPHLISKTALTFFAAKYIKYFWSLQYNGQWGPVGVVLDATDFYCVDKNSLNILILCSAE